MDVIQVPPAVIPAPHYPVGSSVLARVPGRAGWYAGTVVGVPAAQAATRAPGTVRVVGPDGACLDSVPADLRLWSRPAETSWHKRRKTRNARAHVEAANRNSAHCAVEQLDVASGEALARWASAKRAAEALPSVADSADVVACCRAHAPQAGGYAWRFADPRPKVDAADVDEMIANDYAIAIQAANPKKAGTKSAELYDLYKGATTVRRMLELGGRRADVAYDIAHGWLTMVDPALRRRFCGTDEKPARPEDRLHAGAAALPDAPSSSDDDDDAAAAAAP